MMIASQKSSQKSVALFSSSGPMAALALALVAVSLFGPNELLPTGLAAPKSAPKLTATLVAWISSQSEGIVQEMEAIVKHQVEAQQFSVVLYLRYLNLYDKLKVVASKQEQVDKFAWVARKVKAYGIVHRSVYNMVEVFLRDLDTKMSAIEAKEKKGKQVEPTQEWVTIYETMNYIATHAPKGSSLAEEANVLLVKSPTGVADKKRSTRYHLFRRAFN